jgi:copper transport protein
MGTPGLWPLAVAHWLLLAGLAAALGGLAGRGLARQYKEAPAVPLPGPWALRGSLLGLAAAVVLAALQVGHGSLAGFAHLGTLLSSGPGKAAGAEVAGFAVAAALLRLRQPDWAVAALLVVAGAEGFRGHPERAVPIGGALLTWCHLLPAVLWAGMLLYTVRAAIAWRAHPAAVRGLVELYSRAAGWLFALVLLTGLVSALVVVPLTDILTTDYGRVLILKAVLVAVAAGLAVAGRRWVRRPAGPGAGPARATQIEIWTLAAVLAVTGLLVALPPPKRLSQRKDQDHPERIVVARYDS